MNIRSIFMGTPEFAVPILESLIQGSYDVVALYTQPDKPAGRGKLLASPPIKELAMKHKVPVIQPNTLKSAEVVQGLASFEPELIVVAAFGYILPREVLSLPKFGCLNVHPSLLPKHRGPSPVADTLLCGDLFAGVTIMLMDESLDSGPILAQQKVGVSASDTTGSLTLKLARAGAELLMEALPKWLGGELKPQAQDEDRATYSRMIANKDGELNWHLTAVELWRRVRAFNPWPGCYTWWKGKRLKIHSATPLGDKDKGEIGRVVALPKSAPVKVGVLTGEGILGLCQIQLEGKRVMSADEFARGQRDFIGSSLI
ncbi:MAG: methionyl-tRNA formyltransferase [Dehalococcoidia bacterium]|nr:methionyl-tRNA formyltransferase [Dehalococcoidia bacterium]